MSGPAPEDVQRASPLLAEHRRLGARLVDFAGWEMPLQYTGVVAEHRAVRTDVGVFDVSHLGKLRVAGAGALDALQMAVTADVAALDEGAAAYGLVLNEDGGCIDDVFSYRMGPEEWLVVPNAANVGAVGRAIGAGGAEPVDEWDRWAILAIQGPTSFDLVDRLWPGSGATALRLHRWMPFDVFGATGFIARTGYTGERGFELYAPAETAPEAFRALLDEGATAAGLGARDTLRLEMGYALYGHELSPDVNPLEAGLGWVVAWDAPFRGRDALGRVRAGGPRRRTFGIRCKERGVPRQGYDVTAEGRRVGTITSGNFSPTLQTGIALAMGDADVVPDAGTEVAIEARGRSIAGDIVKPPFIEKTRP